jgi:hypothetical protein
MIRAAPMMERHADSAEFPDRESGCRAVRRATAAPASRAARKLTAIELGDALEQFRRRRFVARHEVILKDDDRKAAIED